MKHPKFEEYVLCRGQKFQVEFYYDQDGSMPAKEYFDSSDQRVQLKLLALVTYIAENGKLFDEEKFRQVSKENKIFEFKPLAERFFSFFCKDKKIIITNAYRKKGQKVNARELEKAIKFKNDYQFRVEGGFYYGKED